MKDFHDMKIREKCLFRPKNFVFKEIVRQCGILNFHVLALVSRQHQFISEICFKVLVGMSKMRMDFTQVNGRALQLWSG